MKIRILRLAIRDLAHGQRFYERFEDESANVWRVLDCRQNPTRITQGLKSAVPPSAEDKTT